MRRSTFSCSPSFRDHKTPLKAAQRDWHLSAQHLIPCGLQCFELDGCSNRNVFFAVCATGVLLIERLGWVECAIGVSNGACRFRPASHCVNAPHASTKLRLQSNNLRNASSQHWSWGAMTLVESAPAIDWGSTTRSKQCPYPRHHQKTRKDAQAKVTVANFR